MILLDDECRFVTCFDVLSCDGILSSCHDFQIHTSYSSWFENSLGACITTLIWNLFACFLWNQIKQFLKYDFLNSPALLLKSLFCMLTCEGLFDDQFRKYVFFLNHHYFWNLFEFLSPVQTDATLGTFIRGKIRRALNKTRTVPFIRACLI